MSEADMLLRDILEHGDIAGRDAFGRIVIELVVEPATFERVMAFGGDAAEAEDGATMSRWRSPPKL